MLQPVLLLLHLARLLLRPRRVQQRRSILGRNAAELLYQRGVQLDVLALLCLRNGEPVGVDGEVGRVRADVVEAVGPCEACQSVSRCYITGVFLRARLPA
jgi:hypothetical protein